MADPKSRKPDNDEPETFTDVAAGLGDDVTGASQWKRSKIGFLFGWDAIAGPAKDAYKLGSESVDRTSNLAKSAFSARHRGVSIDPSYVDPEQKFVMAMKANRKSSKDISNSIGVTYKQFWLAMGMFAFFLMIGAGTLAYSGFTAPSVWPFELVFRFALLPLCLVAALRAGFTNWVFRNRSMRSVGEYLRSGSLLPSKSFVAKASKAVATMAMVMFALMAAPVDGHAADNSIVSEVLNTNTPDLFGELLTYVMPDVGPVGTNKDIASGAPQFVAIKNGFFAFSATLLFLGASLLGWQILSSLVASAKEGSMMGQKYHEIWAPIRTVVGFGMLAPIAGGLCAAQIIILYLALWGGNLANIVWVPFVEGMTATSTAADKTKTVEQMAFMSAPQTLPTMRKLFEQELCWKTSQIYHTRNLIKNEGNYNPNPQWEQITDPNWSTWAKNVLNLTGSDTELWAIDYGNDCGRVTVSYENTGDGSRFQDGSGVWTENLASNYNDGIMGRSVKDAINQTRNAVKDQVNTIAESYQSVAAASPRVLSRTYNDKTFKDNFAKTINAAARNYNAVVYQAATDVYDKENPYDTSGYGSGQLTQTQKSAKDVGWAGAGVYYVTLARVQNRIYESASKSPAFLEPTNINTGDASETKSNVWGDLSGDFSSWWDDNYRTISVDIPTNSLTAADETSSIGELLNSAGAPIVSFFEQDWNPHPLNPMQDMIDMGNKMIAGGLATLAIFNTGPIGAAIGGAIAGASGGGIVGGIAGAAASTAISTLGGPIVALITMVATAVLAAGAIHAYVIPMIPYIMVLMFVVGMMVLVAESLVAAPIWAFLHIRLDGEEFMNQVQRPGYMIAFNLLLRPALMIFGLIFSMIIFGAMTYFINKTFMPVVRGYGASNGVGLFAALTMIVIVTYLHFMVAVRAFGLILKLPDRVARWFGQGGEHLNEEQDSEKTAAFVYAATNRVEGMGKSMGMRPKGRNLPSPDKGANGEKDGGKDGKDGGGDGEGGGDAANKQISANKASGASH
jgi:conjugal transfer/type IV secretion protein DotA/TraY